MTTKVKATTRVGRLKIHLLRSENEAGEEKRRLAHPKAAKTRSLGNHPAMSPLGKTSHHIRDVLISHLKTFETFQNPEYSLRRCMARATEGLQQILNPTWLRVIAPAPLSESQAPNKTLSIRCGFSICETHLVGQMVPTHSFCDSLTPSGCTPSGRLNVGFYTSASQANEVRSQNSKYSHVPHLKSQVRGRDAQRASS